MSSAAQSGEVFFRFHIGLHVQPPQVNELGKDLVDGEGVELVQEILRVIRHLLWDRIMGDLEDLQTKLHLKNMIKVNL